MVAGTGEASHMYSTPPELVTRTASCTRSALAGQSCIWRRILRFAAHLCNCNEAVTQGRMRRRYFIEFFHHLIVCDAFGEKWDNSSVIIARVGRFPCR